MAEPTDGRFAYDGLDRVLHEKARLGILTALVTHRDGLSFTDLARLCSLTDGNLSRHLDVLAEEGLVQITKAFAGRRPLTTCKLTASGPQAIPRVPGATRTGAARRRGGRRGRRESARRGRDWP